jgi:hypothetical protein
MGAKIQEFAMNRIPIFLVLTVALAGIVPAASKSSSHTESNHSTTTHGHSASNKTPKRSKSAQHNAPPAKHATSGTVKRDSHGRIARSEAAKHSFEKSHPCPSTGRSGGHCPGYVVDHIKPLACGGADAPSNMQWQTEAEGKAKDAWERKGCR